MRNKIKTLVLFLISVCFTFTTQAVTVDLLIANEPIEAPFDVTIAGSRIVGTIAIIHGFDTLQAGSRQAVSGRYTSTMFAEDISAGLETTGMSRRDADWWGNISDTAVGFVDIALGGVNMLSKISKVRHLKSVPVKKSTCVKTGQEIEELKELFCEVSKCQIYKFANFAEIGNFFRKTA